MNNCFLNPNISNVLFRCMGGCNIWLRALNSDRLSLGMDSTGFWLHKLVQAVYLLCLGLLS